MKFTKNKRVMTTLIKKISIFLFFAMVLFISCAKEADINIPAQNEPSIKTNSTLAVLIQRTSMNDGSNDNIIDKANCFNIQLPVTVIANGTEVMVNTPEDYNAIEAIFDAFTNDTDTLEIIFPITITLSDFTTMVVNNQTELNTVKATCNGENEPDDDIECVDFQYPITVSVFNSVTEEIVDSTITSDEQMFDFIEDLDENDTATINFPITVFLFDGTEVVITDLEQLENVIDTSKDDCDEDDDNDFNDDDCIDCTTDQLATLLTSCSDWSVDELEVNGTHIEDNFTGFAFNFLSGGTISVVDGGTTFSGTWSTTGSGENITLTLSITGLSELDGDWSLQEIKEEPGENKINLKQGDDTLEFESACN